MIGLYRGTSIISRLIQFRTWSPYSHASWIGDNGAEIEAWHKGGVVCHPDWGHIHTPGTEIDLFEVKMSDLQRSVITDFLRTQLGKKYDFGAILGFLTRCGKERLGKWFCSELVFCAFQEAGIDLLCRIEPHKVSPGRLSTSPLLTLVDTLVVPDPNHRSNRPLTDLLMM